MPTTLRITQIVVKGSQKRKQRHGHGPVMLTCERWHTLRMGWTWKETGIKHAVSCAASCNGDQLVSLLVGLKTEEIEELGERFLEAESLDQIRGWAEEKRLFRAQ